MGDCMRGEGIKPLNMTYDLETFLTSVEPGRVILKQAVGINVDRRTLIREQGT